MTNNSDGRTKKDELDLVMRELQEAIDRQTATNEILDLISRSPNDTQPVFDAIVESGTKLFPGAAISVALPVGDMVEAVAVADEDPVRAEAWRRRFPFPLTRDYMHGVAILDARVVDIPDVADTPNKDSAGARNFLASGYRAVTLTPLLRDDKAIGVLGIVRLSPGPLSDAQLAVLKTFAAQAVIAIENVRQFRELQTQLEREAATRNVLEVISRSRADDKPVFDVILENAARLCGSPAAALEMLHKNGSDYVLAANWGEPFWSLKIGDTYAMDSTLVVPRAVSGKCAVQVVDATDDDLYQKRDPIRVKMVEEEGIRTLLAVPLISKESAIGTISLFRREVRPFSDNEIELVQTFAAQAVIAIDNVRQFRDLETRTQEVQALNESLERRVEEQVGEIERIGRLKRFLSPQVVDAVVSSGDDRLLSSHRAQIATLFCDIRGFTAFCETAEPEETIEVLQTYHEEMGKLLSKHGAGVDHRFGDGIMVIFNDPLPCDHPAGDAVRLALSMRDRMATLCKTWDRLGHTLGFGVGISLGYATVGIVGSEGRYDYTASGTAVNLAARLCDEAKDGEILLSPRAYLAVEGEFDMEPAGQVELKGIHAAVEVFQVL